jgi:hypothetical protein
VSVQTTTTALLDPSVPLSGRPSWATHGPWPCILYRWVGFLSLPRSPSHS